MGVQYWALPLLIALGLAAVAARVLWAADWFPPPRDWSRRRKVLVWVVFVAGLIGFGLWAFIASRHTAGPAA